MTLFLVRHGRPLVDPSTPAPEWPLDPAGYDDVWALRDRLPHVTTCYSSPEPKALQTAQLLTDGTVGTLDALAEQRRRGWADDLPGVVTQALTHPDRPALPGWESIVDCRARLLAAVGPLLVAHAGEDVVLVGHATAWVVLQAALRDVAPDVATWRALAFPDLLVVADEHLAPRGSAGRS